MTTLEVRQQSRHPRAARWARRFLFFTVAWNTAECAVAVGAGLAAGSIALVGFGLDSLVEVFAAGVALWQLRRHDAARERRALRLIAVSFFVVAGYVVAESARDLLLSRHAGESTIGIGLAAASLIVMPILSLAKLRVADQLGSATLRAEARETLLCSALSLALVTGLISNATLGWSWADPTAALAIAALAIREGRDAWQGEACC